MQTHQTTPAQHAPADPRSEACHLAESVLHIYEEAFKGDTRPRKLLHLAHDYATGKARDNELYMVRRLLRAVADDAAHTAANCDSMTAMSLHPGIMALNAITCCFDHDVNLSAVQHYAAEALRFAPTPSQSTH